MDRGIVYPGSLPQDTDILNIQQRTMIAAGALLQATFGTGTFVDGLACTQTTVPSMSVTVGQGWIGSLTTVEPNAYGSLAADAVTPLMKMGINLAATNLGPMSAPGTAGQSVVYLVQAAFSEADTSAVVLPYYNSSNPAVPYSGPSNTGTAQNTKRGQTVTLQLKQGTAATTGSQTTPAPDSGFTGLYAITIANGASTVVNANIATLATAPFIQWKLPNIAPGFSREVAFATSGSWTAPAGVTRAKIRMVGGGGGSGSISANCASGGGAAGSYAEGPVTVVPGTTYAITIGAGGAAGVGGAGGTGGTTSFGALMSAPGGGGSPSVSSGGGVGGSSGAAGSGGALNLLGAAGGNYGAVAGQNIAGPGSGSIMFPQGGLPNSAGFYAGAGAGGVAASGSASGYVGASGYVIVEY